ncbi:MAG: DUF86 domain-containing protein [Calditrichaeota bacterium]|nr:MAG: DUF86 domain-containing protein [Calditrichota bacterium]
MYHILDAIYEIEKYVQDKSFSDFMSDSMLQSARIRQLEIIGEAAGKISIDIKEKTGNVAWREIISLRNLLIHAYFGIDLQIVWEIIQNDLPSLKAQIRAFTD